MARGIEGGPALGRREAVTNSARKAEGGAARVSFDREGDRLGVAVVDDGVGGVGSDGNGLAGMRERVARMGGTLAIESPRGQGTRLGLRVTLVVAEPEAVAVAEAAAPEAREGRAKIGRAHV